LPNGWYLRTLALEHELDRLLELEPINAEGRHLRDAMIVDARDKLLVFLARRDGAQAQRDFQARDECVPLGLGCEGLRRSLLHCLNRPPPRPEPTRRHPRGSDRAVQARYLLIIGGKGVNVGQQG
jgi:hypothetical protein